MTCVFFRRDLLRDLPPEFRRPRPPDVGGGQGEDRLVSGRHRAMASDGQTVNVDAAGHRDRQLRGHHLSGRVRQEYAHAAGNQQPG